MSVPGVFSNYGLVALNFSDEFFIKNSISFKKITINGAINPNFIRVCGNHNNAIRFFKIIEPSSYIS